MLKARAVITIYDACVAFATDVKVTKKDVLAGRIVVKIPRHYLAYARKHLGGNHGSQVRYVRSRNS